MQMRIQTTTVALAVGLVPIVGRAGKHEAPAATSQSAQRETVLETNAVVEKVDQATREVQLRASDGELVTVVAGPAVRNLPQLAAGDQVRVTYYESVAARMAEPGAGGPTSAVGVAARAPQGQKPAGLVGATLNMVVTMVSYDPASALATFTTPEGVTESVTVHPEMRAFAAARRPGDRVEIELTRAVAMSIVESES
jgi:hypothetical protein